MRVVFDGETWADLEGQILLAADRIRARGNTNTSSQWTLDEVEGAIAQASLLPPPAEAPRTVAVTPFCPTHNLAMTFRPAGVSKTKVDAQGQPKRYGAFYTCPERGCQRTIDAAQVAAKPELFSSGFLVRPGGAGVGSGGDYRGGEGGGGGAPRGGAAPPYSLRS